MTSRRCLPALLAALLLSLTSAAHADDSAAAREFNSKAMSAYALGRYGEAANYYEKAFEAKPLPELLYNAAQANRLAGNKKRAIELYQNYLRVFGSRVGNRSEVEGHIEELKKAIESENKAATSPPLTPAPVPSGNSTTTPETKPDLTPSQQTLANATGTPSTEPATPPPQTDKPITKKAWFWGLIGGIAALAIAGAVVGIVVGTSSPADPMPTYGSVKVF